MIHRHGSYRPLKRMNSGHALLGQPCDKDAICNDQLCAPLSPRKFRSSVSHLLPYSRDPILRARDHPYCIYIPYTTTTQFPHVLMVLGFSDCPAFVLKILNTDPKLTIRWPPISGRIFCSSITPMLDSSQSLLARISSISCFGKFAVVSPSRQLG
jgi:hypothetical protein